MDTKPLGHLNKTEFSRWSQIVQNLFIYQRRYIHFSCLKNESLKIIQNIYKINQDNCFNPDPIFKYNSFSEFNLLNLEKTVFNL